MEATAAWWIERRRHLALELDLFRLGSRLGDKHRREQRLGVRVPHVTEQRFRGALLDDLAEIHDDRVVRHVAHRCEIVGDQ